LYYYIKITFETGPYHFTLAVARNASRTEAVSGAY
jgi:hypothetical protein